MPNLGMVEYRDEHLPQKIWPQARQWCWDTDTGQVTQWPGEGLQPHAHSSQRPRPQSCQAARSRPWAGETGRAQALSCSSRRLGEKTSK